MNKLLNLLCMVSVSMIIVACDSSDKVNVDKKSISDASEISDVVDSSSIIYSEEKMKELLDKSLNNGDCDSYSNVLVNSTFSGKEYSLFYETQVMAYKYNCAVAYYYLGMEMYSDRAGYGDEILLEKNKLNSMNSPSVWSEDNMTKSMALYYFLKAYELGEKSAYYELVKYFGKDPKKFPKSSDFIKGRKK